MVNAPTGVVVDDNTGLLSWTPTSLQLGERTFGIKVKDGKGGESTQILKATVINPVPNTNPVINSQPRTITRLGNTYVYEINATDADGDILSYNLLTKPSGMTKEKNLISWTPTAAQSGDNSVVIQVSDSQGGSTTQAFNLSVASVAPNLPPVITNTPNLITNLLQEYQVNFTGVDPDGDALVWSLDAAPSGMVIDANTGALRWQPSSTFLGGNTVKVRLTDSYGMYVGTEFSLYVNGTNTPPIINTIPITQIGLNQDYQYQVIATDAENTLVTYSLLRQPVGMTIDKSTGLIQWSPSAIGSYEIALQATDAQGGATTQVYNLIVGELPINRAPSITSNPVGFADTSSSYTYQIQASDPDGDVLSYQLLTGANGMTIDATTGLLSWGHPVAGNYQVVVAVKDAAGGVATQGFSLKTLANQLPVITSNNPPTTATVGALYAYDIHASDPEGTKLKFSLDDDSIALGITLDDWGRLRWNPAVNDIGTHQVVVTVTDSYGGSKEFGYDLNVVPDSVAPKVSLIANQNTFDFGDVVSFKVAATDNVAVKNLQLMVDGTPLVIDAAGVAQFSINHTGSITATATAIDTAGNVESTSTEIIVLDPNDTTAPIVSLDLSAIEDGKITAPTNIIGTVTDSNLKEYVLEVAPVGSEDFVEVFRGSADVTDGVLGSFDPSLLENDTYTVRLTAYDTNGQGSVVEDTISVAGDLKLGNFKLSFTDLSVPVTGIPISLTRTYDSLTANTTDDFGYGWRMEFRDTDLRTSLGRDRVYEELGVRSHLRLRMGRGFI